MAKPITSFEVAERAGVSQSTVSRVFSANSPNVAETTRQRVLQAAAELGYRPNIIARMMSTRQTNIIGIVMANITSPFYPYVLEKFLQQVQAIGRQALLFTPAPDQDVDALLPLILQYQVDALIVTSATVSSAMAAECARSGTPVILFNRTVPDANVSAVCADNVGGGRQVADLLLDTGHQRIAYIAGPANTSTNIDREQGFSAQLQTRGYVSLQREPATYTYESGFAAAHKLLSQPVPPDALFCANDIMALGAMDAARRLNIAIPDAVSIIGFDDIPMASWDAYHLTTISQEVDVMIDRTMQLLLSKIDNPYSPATLELVPGRLCVRGSVRGLR